MSTYNGWTNYATWRINLEMIDGSTASDYVSGKSRNVRDLSDALRGRVEENITGSGSGLAVEYALAFIDYVNWREIAEHMLGDAEPEEEEDDEDEDDDQEDWEEEEMSEETRAGLLEKFGDAP